MRRRLGCGSLWFCARPPCIRSIAWTGWSGAFRRGNGELDASRRNRAPTFFLSRTRDREKWVGNFGVLAAWWVRSDDIICQDGIAGGNPYPFFRFRPTKQGALKGWGSCTFSASLPLAIDDGDFYTWYLHSVVLLYNPSHVHVFISGWRNSLQTTQRSLQVEHQT